MEDKKELKHKFFFCPKYGKPERCPEVQRPSPASKVLYEALKDNLDTIRYCKGYVENRGLSAEDDCVDSIEKAEKALTQYEKGLK